RLDRFFVDSHNSSVLEADKIRTISKRDGTVVEVKCYSGLDAQGREQLLPLDTPINQQPYAFIGVRGGEKEPYAYQLITKRNPSGDIVRKELRKMGRRFVRGGEAGAYGSGVWHEVDERGVRVRESLLGDTFITESGTLITIVFERDAAS